MTKRLPVPIRYALYLLTGSACIALGYALGLTLKAVLGWL